jgi:3-phytase
MGVALYTTYTGDIYAIVSRKTGPSGSYLGQYLLGSNKKGNVTGKLVRKFGNFSGKNEIESIAVDNELGYVYCSDESTGIRKYYAHPDSSGHELAFFGTTGFTDNHEGISIYKFSNGTGYILISDQQANAFRVFPREGTSENKHDHPLLKVIATSTLESDGSEVTSIPLPGFPKGLFVAMSDDKTFQFYQWEEIAGDELKR